MKYSLHTGTNHNCQSSWYVYGRVLVVSDNILHNKTTALVYLYEISLAGKLDGIEQLKFGQMSYLANLRIGL